MKSLLYLFHHQRNINARWCPDCKVCMHILKSDCPEWLKVGTIWTHIHAVWRLISTTTIPYLQGAQVDKSSNEDELESLCSCTRNASHSDATLIKERICEKMVALNKEIDTCDNEEALSTLEKQLGAAYSTFTAVKKYGHIPSDLISTQCASPPNKKMETYRRFYLTKWKQCDEKELYLSTLTSASLQRDPSKSFTLSLG